MFSCSNWLAKTSSPRNMSNPMENSVGLTKIFEYFCTTFDAVKTIRVVNKFWKQTSEVQWQKFTVPVRIFQNNEGHDDNKDENAISLEQFMSNQTEVKSRNICLVKWTIEDEHFDNSRSKDTSAAAFNKRFWSSYSRNVVFLTLEKCTMEHWETFLPVENLLTGLKNLERLNLVECSIKKSDFPATSKSCFSARMQTSTQLRMAHDNLKFLRLQSVVLHPKFCWIQLFRFFQYLEHLSIRDQNYNLYGMLTGICYSRAWTSLRHFDIMKSHKFALEMMPNGCFDGMKRFTLRKLTLDVGYSTKQDQKLQILLDCQAESLKKLHLYRAPVVQPYQNMFRSVMSNLTELHLWGSLCGNLNFLRMMPCLEVLVWNTSCYDADNHGERMHVILGMEKPSKLMHSLLVEGRIVENTNDLGVDFQLGTLTTLEMDWTMTTEGWQRLGKWMPNLEKLKAKICSDEELGLVAKLWPELEDLELVHGSKVSAYKIFDLVFLQKSFSCMINFVWNSCPCTDTKRNKEDAAETFLGDLAHVGMSVPWTADNREKNELTSTEETGCLQAMFEKALIHGQELDTVNYFGGVYGV